MTKPATPPIVKQVRDEEFHREIHERLELFEKEKNASVELAKTATAKAYDVALAKKAMEINDLKSQLNMQKMSQAASLQDALNKKELELAQKDQLIAGLTARLNAGKQEIELAVAKVVNEKQQELNDKEQSILQLTSAIENGKKESELREQTLITQYEEKLKFKDEEIERYKDFKLRQSTKMVGESWSSTAK